MAAAADFPEEDMLVLKGRREDWPRPPAGKLKAWKMSKTFSPSSLAEVRVNPRVNPTTLPRKRSNEQHRTGPKRRQGGLICTPPRRLIRTTVMPAYSDTLGERQKCHCKRGVTVTIQSLAQSSNCECFNTLLLDKK